MSRAWFAILAAVAFGLLCALAAVALGQPVDPLDAGSIVLSPSQPDALSMFLDEPLIRLGTAAALVGVVLARARKVVPWLRVPLHGWLAALVLGVVTGLVGIAPPLPSALPIAGQIAAGIGAGSFAAFVRTGARKRIGGKPAPEGGA
jgi:hypothetical protein